MRKQLAARLDRDGGDMPVAGLAALMKQFRDVDAQIRAADLCEAQADDDEDDEDDGAETGWDPSKL